MKNHKVYPKDKKQQETKDLMDSPKWPCVSCSVPCPGCNHCGQYLVWIKGETY